MIAALVPAKGLDQAKGRLSAILTDTERRSLALAMLEDVVRAISAVPAIESVTVVSPDEDVLRAARGLGAEAVPEPQTARGINQALAYAAARLPTGDGVLVVLADVPSVHPGDLAEVIGQLPERGAVICPSEDRGTSALALRPRDVLPFRFGDKSFQAHKREAAARGVPHKVVRLQSLANDIDGPDDLRELLLNPGETATHRLLAALRVAERLG
jgi:2-phospho-L-lactate guanylyltransferase